MKLVATIQDSFARILGLHPTRRAPLVRAMLRRPPGDAAGYWLQLVISTALATFGLALDSTAVVIGAMLIAPLMRPIVEFAMGLATGSTPLVFRTGVRAVASVAFVVVASMLIARLLPFHEVTNELLARTAPTILDLFVAAACALAGAYAVVIASNEVATTAAGTSIGISLVPPLCTAGYAVAIGDWDMAIGAGLLFTANVTGIVVVASALFVLVGFGQVDMREEERSLDDETGLGAATRIGRSMSKQRRLAGIIRAGVPLVLLGAIALPLQSAVLEMSRRSRIRQRVAQLMTRGTADRIVQYSLDQTSRPIVLRVVIVGEQATARSLEERLRRELRTLGAGKAAVSVWAVPDATSMSALSARIDDIPAVLAPPAPAPPPRPLAERVRASWPSSAGALVSVWTSDGPPARVRVVHLGDELGASARELLGHAVAVENATPTIDEVALAPLEEGADGPGAWLVSAAGLVAEGRDIPEIRYCIDTPKPPADRRREGPEIAVVRSAVDRLAATPHVTVTVRDRFRITPQTTDCPP